MSERLTQFSRWLWRRTAFLRTRPGLVILAGSLVGLRLLWIHLERPAHLEANADLWGSIRNFYGQVEPNHDGSRFAYVAIAADRGHALFLCDTATGKKRQIIEDRQGVGYFGDDFDIQAGPWSPDDRCFVCLVSNRVMVCSPDRQPEMVMIDDHPFSRAVWLTPTRFAYVSAGTNLCVADKRGDGQWTHQTCFIRHVPLTSLTAIGSDTVAWLENGEAVCRADLSGGDASSPNAMKAARRKTQI